MVVAKSEAGARDAAKWLQETAITYTKLQGVVSLDEAIKKKRFFKDRTTTQEAPRRILKVIQFETDVLKWSTLQVSRNVAQSSSIDWSQFEADQEVVVVEGSQRAGSQYHFYMETQSAFAFPTEQGGIKVYASTQSPDKIQGKVAQVCDLPANQVTIEVRVKIAFIYMINKW